MLQSYPLSRRTLVLPEPPPVHVPLDDVNGGHRRRVKLAAAASADRYRPVGPDARAKPSALVPRAESVAADVLHVRRKDWSLVRGVAPRELPAVQSKEPRHLLAL